MENQKRVIALGFFDGIHIGHAALMRRTVARAEEMGADALSIITPSFALASQKELYDHYVAVAKQVNIPIILYNIPPRTGNKLLPETVQALCLTARQLKADT